MRTSIALLSSILVASLLAQQPEFKSSTELVTVPVNVTSAGVRRVDGLTIDDFRLFEDGVLQPLAYARRERQPLSVSVMLDTSGSMREHNRFQLAMTSLREIIVNIDPGDEVAIVSAGRTVRELLPWSAPLRAAGSQMDIKVADTSSLNSAIFDGLAGSLDQIKRATHQRRVIVLISDGLENASRRTGLRDIVKTRQQSETTIYAFHVSPSPPQGTEMQVLPSLVDDTGGAVLPIKNLEDVNAAVKELMTDLRDQYLLAYAPSKAFDGKYRKLKVEATRSDLVVRHRGGYLAIPAGR